MDNAAEPQQRRRVFLGSQDHRHIVANES
uniref:Uncharacterized protein n=1 Tax=Physcomitrium patens TaxID=3218 RepID=A0A2K1KCD7_PHYPA|nr:hypothetical protein PHYPA_010632 [Physcomitrium patens]